MAQKTLALIDASNYIYRAFHAIPRLTGPAGRPTNAVLGFANMLLKLRTDRQPDALAVCFDRKERTFREDLDAGYKAQRQPMPDELVPQIEDAKRMCRLMALQVVEEPGYEADDVIATLATRAAAAGWSVEIASADKDLFQLVEDGRIVVWHPVDERVLDVSGVVERFGVPPARVVDVLALKGDSVDNIPGVKGIGEKSALELVMRYGSLEALYEHLEEVPGRQREKLRAGRDSAFLSRELATVKRDAPVSGESDAEALLAQYGCRPLTADETRELAAFYDEVGFTRLKRELLSAHSQQATLFDAPPAAEEAPREARWETSREALAAMAGRAHAAGRIGFHIAAAPGQPFPPTPLAAVVAVPGEEPVAFPLEAAGLDALSSLLSSKETTLVVHDAKRVHLLAALLGVPIAAPLEDAMLSAYAVAPGLFAHDLAGDARGILALPPDVVPSAKDAFGAAGPTEETISAPAGLAYLAPRAELPLRLAEALEPKLTPPLRRIRDEIEMPLAPVLARMELAGIAVDAGVLADLARSFAARLSQLETEIHAVAGEPFNIGSPPQLGRILFEKLAYPVVRKTAKTKSYATDSEVLGELAALNTGPLPRLVLSWRELSKLKGTYVDALPAHIAKDGRIHTRYDQAVAATGRLSSTDPNLQNIPVRTEEGRAIRTAFVAPPGRRLVAADYSQIELRILAHLTGDEALLDVFRRGEDIHRATAARMFGVDPALVTHDQRRGAKTINFGILYGMGPYALSGQLGVSQAEAKAFIAAYFTRFPKVRAFLDRILESARQTGCTETLFGRTRPIVGLHDRNFAVRSNAERMAVNAPFQGAAADLIKKAMIDLDRRLKDRVPSARLLLQVHDELVLECDAADAEKTADLARSTMEGAAELGVPLTAEVGTGQNWTEAKG